MKKRCIEKFETLLTEMQENRVNFHGVSILGCNCWNNKLLFFVLRSRKISFVHLIWLDFIYFNVKSIIFGAFKFTTAIKSFIFEMVQIEFHFVEYLIGLQFTLFSPVPKWMFSKCTENRKIVSLFIVVLFSQRWTHQIWRNIVTCRLS